MIDEEFYEDYDGERSDGILLASLYCKKYTDFDSLAFFKTDDIAKNLKIEQPPKELKGQILNTTGLMLVCKNADSKEAKELWREFIMEKLRGSTETHEELEERLKREYMDRYAKHKKEKEERIKLMKDKAG